MEEVLIVELLSVCRKAPRNLLLPGAVELIVAPCLPPEQQAPAHSVVVPPLVYMYLSDKDDVHLLCYKGSDLR